MKTIFWKELRENWKWAVLVLLVVAGGMAMVVFPATQSPWWRGLPTMNPDYGMSPFLLLTTIGSATAGLAMGLLQILPERHRDQWSFLVHRPVSRSAIFFGKSLAGLTLLVVALGLPFVVSLLWLALPGHLAAPFHLRMALPGIADILCSAVYYFAGLLIGMRNARWLGSRCLVIVPPLFVTMAVMLLPAFWYALVAIAMGVTTLGLAAWGSFVHGGSYEKQPLVCRLCLGIGLLVGILGIGSFGWGTVAALASTSPQDSAAKSIQYEIDKDGNVLRLVRTGWRITEVTDFDGNPLEKYDPSVMDSSQLYNQYLRTISIYHTDTGANRRSSYRSMGSVLSSFQNLQQTTQWHYSHQERLFLAYDMMRRVMIGGIGPNGYFAGSKLPSERFPDELLFIGTTSPVGLTFQRDAYMLELNQRELKSVFHSHEDRIVGASATQEWGAVSPEMIYAVIVAGDIHIYSLDGEELLTTPLKYDPTLYPYWRIGVTQDDRYFIWYQDWQRTNERPSHITVFSRTGEELADYELPPAPLARQSLSWGSIGSFALIPFGASISSVLVAMAGTVLGFAPWSDVVTLTSMWQDLPDGAVLATGVAFFTALACAIAAIAIARRYAFSNVRKIVWSVLAFFLGPAGLLLLFCLLELPVRERCPSCERWRIVNRNECEHCQAAFLAPPLDGTEIFAAC